MFTDASELSSSTWRETMTRRPLPAVVAATGLVGAATSFWLGLHRPPAYPVALSPGDVVFAVPFVSFAVMGALVIRSQPRHLVGWAMSVTGVLVPVALALIEAGRQAYGSNAGLAASLWFLGELLFKPGFLAIVIALLLFPDGRLPNARWRVIPTAMLLLLLPAEISSLVLPGRLDEGYGPVNPLAWPAAARVLSPLSGSLGLALAAALLLASVVSLATRYRRSGPGTRRQLQLLALAVLFMAACWVIGNGVKTFVRLPATIDLLDSALLGLSLAAVAVAIGYAVIRGQLIEIDVVVSRALAYGALAIPITAGYVLVLAGLGAAAGGRFSAPAAALLTALLAVAFEPLRKRAQRLADRLVYGPRAEPYDVLASFTRAVAASLPIDWTLERMARVLAEGTRSERAEVWADEPAGRRLLSAAGDGAGSAGIATEIEVVHQGRRRGWLRLVRSPGNPLAAREERLLSDLAVQAGLVFEQARLESELRASRRRLAAAQTDERARLERDLHDGAQQHLLALSARLGLLPDGAAAPLREELAAAIDSIRDVARGLYPKILETGGLKPALSGLARRLPMPVRVSVISERLPREIEGVIYFCCSEALQNVAKHSSAEHVVLSVSRDRERVCLEVSDDGVGLSPRPESAGRGVQNMRDRIEAIDGEFELRVHPLGGTVVRASIPVPVTPPGR